ncbi:MAG: hypothetical protein RLZZ297_104 [Chloroflexota bacterium]|jgi:hypothetical protein
MIDFVNKGLFKLAPIPEKDMHGSVRDLLVDGEVVLQAFSSMRDQVIFTSKRVIAANVQGVIGKKIDFTSIPYRKINTYSVETAGLLDLECELELWISEVGKVRFEIRGSFDIVKLNKAISTYALD